MEEVRGLADIELDAGGRDNAKGAKGGEEMGGDLGQ